MPGLRPLSSRCRHLLVFLEARYLAHFHYHCHSATQERDDDGRIWKIVQMIVTVEDMQLIIHTESQELRK